MNLRATVEPVAKKTAPPTLSDAGYAAVARRFQILSDPTRLKLLHQLRHGPRNVGSLVEAVGSSQANVSKHLALLSSAGLVTRHRQGTSALYEILDRSVYDLCESACGGVEKTLERGHIDLFETED